MDNLLAKIDFDKYTWKSLPSANGFEGRGRLLAGGELVQDVLNRYNKGFQTLFFAFYADLTAEHAAAEVIEAGRDAWVKLRYLVPTIAALVTIDDDDSPLLRYYSTSADGISAWANQTFTVHQTDVPEIDLDVLRRDLGQLKVPSQHDQETWMHLVMAKTGMISKLGFLFHTHHSPFDGSAVKILANLYLKEFAKALGGVKVADNLKWGDEISHLLPAAFNIILPTEPRPIHPDSDERPTFHHPYYAETQKVVQAFASNAQIAYNLKPRKGDSGWPRPDTEALLFSKEESEKLMRKLKGESTSYTVTHAAHAALVMVNIFDNPPAAEDAAKSVSCEFLVNSRRYLQKPYSDREGYPGYALSVVPHGFPLTLFLSQTGEPLPLDKPMLVALMRRARDVYNKLKEMPVAFSFMVPVCDMFASLLKQQATDDRAPENAFRLSHDGPGETFIDHTFYDTAGHTVLEISKFFTSLNRPDPAPFFRVSSWNGVLELRADYNSNVIRRDEVKGYLEKWKEFITLASEITKDDY
ncbi:hypothetical protein D9757_005575 [Collybiopsis confluens]|uniref:Uncharacterized protein n=1 Tax=Collybiopsis confluens TaxID=2823264 RepID=A0A8H5MBW0_9AGAR|nr:hypothetical protein D9757_005575 [Collybiopsis confluens]